MAIITFDSNAIKRDRFVSKTKNAKFQNRTYIYYKPVKNHVYFDRQAAQVEESPTSDHKLNGFNSGMFRDVAVNFYSLFSHPYSSLGLVAFLLLFSLFFAVF